MAAERAGRAPLRGLYALTPEGLPIAELERRVRCALEGGAALVQYRAKSVDAERAREEARRLLACCRAFGVALIVNDSLELARAVGADGLHLGREDGDVRAARAALPGAILGVSCYDDPARAAAAARDGADYVAIGSVFASATKPGAVHAPLECLREARQASGLAVAAIGGIDASNAALAIAAGADLLAVINAVFSAPDVRAAARAIANAFPPEAGIRQTEKRHESEPLPAQPRPL